MPLEHWERTWGFGGVGSARGGSGTQKANPGAPAARYRSSPAPRGSSSQWATTGALWKGVVGQAREGATDKTGVGRTKDDGAASVQRKPPGTPRRRTRHPR